MSSLGHLRLVYFVFFILYFIKMNVHNSFKSLTFYPDLNQSGNTEYYLRLLNRISQSFFRDYLNDLCLQTKQNTP